jgi:LysR family transcriptional regulator, hca operon transcriptional activator
MELRHLRYFVAVAEEGSLTVAAEKRLHTAQPSLSRQMRDLEQELGVTLMNRVPRGIELTAAGRVFLDHARIALLQVEAAHRAAAAAGSSFALGFLTGYEMDWLPPVMSLLREKLPSTEIVIYSQSSSPELAAGLMAGKIDLAFLRQEKNTPGLDYRLLVNDPLVVLMPAGHRLAVKDVVSPQDFAGETLIGVPKHNAPALRNVTDSYGARQGIDMTPDHEALNLAMAISLVVSTGGIALMPLYAGNLLPPTVVSRPVLGAPPLIDLSIGYNAANTSPLLRFLLSKLEDLKFRATAADRPQTGYNLQE